MRASIPIALLTAGAVATHTLPAQALPAARVNLVRIDGNGVRPLPDVAGLLAQAEPTPATGQQGTAIFFLPAGDEDLRIRLAEALPAGTAGELLLRVQRAPWNDATSGPEAGEIVERLGFDSARVQLSDSRRYLQIDPEREIQAGEVLSVDFTALNVLPRPETPVRFALPETACLARGPRSDGGETASQEDDAAQLEEQDDLVYLLRPGDDLEISFATPLPPGLSGDLVLRDQPAPGDTAVSGPAAGDVVERIALSSPQVYRSDDGVFLAITPGTRRTLGWITTVDLSQLSAATDPETPVRFTLARPACPIPRKTAPCPILPGAQATTPASTTAAGAAAAAGTGARVALGILVVGAIAGLVAVLAGNGGGNGGNNGVPSR